MNIIASAVNLMREKARSNEGSEVDILSAFHKMTEEIIGDLCLGESTGCVDRAEVKHFLSTNFGKEVNSGCRLFLDIKTRVEMPYSRVSATIF